MINNTSFDQFRTLATAPESRLRSVEALIVEVKRPPTPGGIDEPPTVMDTRKAQQSAGYMC